MSVTGGWQALDAVGVARLAQVLSDGGRHVDSAAADVGGLVAALTWTGRAARSAAAGLERTGGEARTVAELLQAAAVVVGGLARMLAESQDGWAAAARLADAHDWVLTSQASVVPDGVHGQPGYVAPAVADPYRGTAGHAAVAQAGLAAERLAACDRSCADALDDIATRLRQPLELLVGPAGASAPSAASVVVLARAQALFVRESAPPPVLTTGGAVAAALWCDGLTPSSRMQLLTTHPDELGNLDGLPPDVRDRANRIQLVRDQATLAAFEQVLERRGAWRRTLDALRPQLAASPYLIPLLGTGGMTELAGYLAGRVAGGGSRGWAPAFLKNTLDKVHDRERHLAVLAAAVAAPGVRLLALDPNGDGRGVVSIGDVAHAAHVGVLVPGMNTDLGDIGDLVDKARTVDDSAGGDRHGTATVAWIGYDAPNKREVLTDHDARVGAADLVHFVDGLHAEAQGPDPVVTVVGHSYGSLLVGIAARMGLVADNLVLIGSPGVEAKTASQLGITTGQVYDGLDRGDVVVRDIVYGAGSAAALFKGKTTWYGPNPASRSFGAVRFATGAATGHSGYYAAGTDSELNIAAVVAGDDELVTRTPWLPDPPPDRFRCDPVFSAR